MIGVFDSGYGGLSVMKELTEKFPEYRFVYLGDNARAPYGVRSKEIITEYCREAMDWFFEEGAEMVVLACNTASAEAYPTLVEIFGQRKILGVVDSLAEYVAKNVSKEEKVAVIATPSTIRSGKYKSALENQGFKNILEKAAPLLVPLVETGSVAGPMAEAIISDALSSITREGVSNIVLACTHYYFLKETIEKMYPHLKLYDASLSFPQTFGKFLSENEIQKEQAAPEFYTTDAEDDFARFVKKNLGLEISAERIRL